MVCYLYYRLESGTESDGEEMKTVFDKTLTKRQQSMAMITDEPISSVFKIFAGQDPTHLESMTIAETGFFRAWRPGGGHESQQKMKLTGSIIYLPCSIVEDHWSLLIYAVPINELYLMDSAVKLDDNGLTEVQRLVRGFSVYYEVAGIEEAPLKVAQCYTWQGSNHNCGAWATYFGQQIMRGEQLDENEDMHEFRKQMVEYLKMRRQ